MQLKYHTYELKNGIKVLLVPTTKVQSINVSAYLHSGQIYETDDQNGINHFVEHLSLSAKNKYKDKFELNDILDRLGANINGYTSDEDILYYIHLPKQHLKFSIEYIHDVLYDAKYDTKDVEIERGIIIDELAKSESDISESAYMYFREQSLPKGNVYGRTILGSKKNLLKFSRDELFEAYKNMHNPSRLLLVVIGNFNTDEVKKLIKSNFIDDKKAKTFKDTDRKIELNKSLTLTKNDKRADLVYTDINIQTIFAPNWDMKLQLTLKLIAIIFGVSSNSRLRKRLREEEGLLYHVYSHHILRKTFGYFAFGYECPPEVNKKVINILFEELDKFIKLGVTKAELEREVEFFNNISTMSLDNIYRYAESHYVSAIFDNRKVYTADDIIKIYNSITVDDINNMIKEKLNIKSLNLLAYGKVNETVKKDLLEVRKKYI